MNNIDPELLTSTVTFYRTIKDADGVSSEESFNANTSCTDLYPVNPELNLDKKAMDFYGKYVFFTQSLTDSNIKDGDWVIFSSLPTKRYIIAGFTPWPVLNPKFFEVRLKD